MADSQNIDSILVHAETTHLTVHDARMPQSVERLLSVLAGRRNGRNNDSRIVFAESSLQNVCELALSVWHELRP